ncbi:MAG: 2-dehydropantoate 2-reductase, partial [Asticcacaulis sp.]
VVFAARQGFGRLMVANAGEMAPRRRANVATSPQQILQADWVLLCVKAHQVAGAEAWLKAAVGPHTRVAILQNGVEHRARVTPYVPEGTVLVPVVVDIPAGRSAPGVAEWRGRASLLVADTAEGTDFCALFAGSFVKASVTPDYVTENWKKLCVNAPGGAVLALTGQPMKVFHQPGIVDIARAILSECVAVGRAEGADLPDSLIEEQMARFMMAAPDDTNSMYDDRAAGRETEWDARNAVIARLGRKHGIATPVSDILVPLLAAQSPA